MRRNVGLDMFTYLQEECRLLQSETEVHIISSDIIESCFGVFKAMKSPDKLCGVTRHALVLPLAVNFISEKNRELFDFIAAMENVHYKERFRRMGWLQFTWESYTREERSHPKNWIELRTQT